MPDIKNSQKFSHPAMATMFEIIISAEDPQYARQAAQAAFAELDRLERELSRFIENSDISRINALKPGQRVSVGPDTFHCLEISERLYQETDGVFDVTIGTLVANWRATKPLLEPVPEPVQPFSGVRQLELSLSDHAAAIHGNAVIIDLGGVGKGYAVDQMANLLREWGLERALIHGGTSSALAQEPPCGQPGWPITLHHPKNEQTLLKLALKNQSLSGSGIRKGQHIINPKTGHPVSDRLAAWALAPTAAVSDALSTTFMIMPLAAIRRYCERHPTVAALVITAVPEIGSAESIVRLGDWGKLAIE